MIKLLSHFLILGFTIILFGCQKEDIIPPQNKVPIADAGPSATITLPTNSITLSGSGKDDDGNVVAYLWSQTSGPSSTSIENPGAASTLVKNFNAGTYIFQLMVTDDKGAVGVDTVSIVVNAPVIKTLTLQPANNSLEYQIVNLNGQDASGSGGPELVIAAWTKESNPYTLREVLKFDISTIPVNATIVSADLFLYSTPVPLTGNYKDANFGSNNSLILQQITANWVGSSIGWFNQPTTTTTNQIVIPSTTKSMLDIDLNVTTMIQSMVSSSTNYGFSIRLQNETIYTSRIFVSSYNNLYPDKHPKLVVVYQ